VNGQTTQRFNADGVGHDVHQHAPADHNRYHAWIGDAARRWLTAGRENQPLSCPLLR
jgi:hypothetical protein